MLAVGRTNELTFRRACGVHKSFKLQACDNVLAGVVSILVEIVEIYGFEACGYDDCAVFLGEDLFFLFKINGFNAAI